jgi:hypothetical protein
MNNFIDTAQEFYKTTPIQHIYGKKRTLYTKQLILVIETAPFLTKTEKQQMKDLVPLYSTKVIHNIKKSLIQQGIIFLRLNPDYKRSIETWLEDAAKRPF